MALKKILTALFLIVSSNFAFAQETKTLTLDEALRIGLENSEELHSSKSNVISYEARLSEVNSNRLPSLSLSAGYTRLSEIDPFSLNTPFGNFEFASTLVNNYSAELSLRQPLFTGFRLSSSSNIAEYNYKAVQEEFVGDRQQVILNIKSAYWNLFKANEIKKVVDENISQVNAHLKDVKNMFDEGLATRNDVLKVQVQLGEARLRQIDAENAVRLSKINLNNTVGLPVDTDVQITDNIQQQVSELKNSDELIDAANSKRPELRALENRVKASESGITLAQSGWYPQVYVFGDYNYARPNQRVFPAKDEFKGTWDVGVTLSFDIWNWNKTGNQTTQAEMQYQQVQDSYKIVKDAVALEVNSNYLNVIRAKERLSVSESGVEQAKENYRVTDDLFKEGLTTNSELIDAEVALLTAKTNYVQSLVDYELAKANLQKSTGELE